MFQKFYPSEDIRSTYDIDFERYYKEGYRGVIFDVDNTLVPHDSPADERAKKLFKRLDAIGMQYCFTSNNKEARVKAFCEAVGGKYYVYKANKPSIKGYETAMKLMFKGYQGDFPGKSFCKLSRMRKSKNEQSAITLLCLPVFFAKYNLCPSWVQVRIDFCSNWAEVGFGTSAQFGRRCISFYSQLGNNFARIL